MANIECFECPSCRHWQRVEDCSAEAAETCDAILSTPSEDFISLSRHNTRQRWEDICRIARSALGRIGEVLQ